ncbi:MULTISPECIES: efflux transporter outer membrane subunit [Myroides]|uniref:NodT family efflux transporter, outer membrane factor (OMF) lipoprotein n=1 Tax=Myroides odoratimimus CIP 101113 TaxID=883154 RepID=A0AAV3F4N0_9FLAO|nr:MULTISPECIES: efflux transporter outer membrane subunit [Myroides]APA92848.1 RND transporter [Myroides sp. ZB35]EHO13479.1 NodT family efflux transporter, outer membrane factor (OMF) lipoprotein [Myroides odoratimimus CIP 101113]MDM1035319.1 efflux transporter outer membrane subunit [Myroides odoratimimus]MDM1037157.1 efflux transporter outer membrane subunit [Myroides odoratimimus]MDM1051211.1 efflux transporter outer membrane subunit [Myroides odoratimimus]
MVVQNKKTMRKIVYIAIGSTLLTACKVGKNYERPTVDTPEQFYQETASDTTANNLAKLSYSEFFKNTELTSLIESALERNADLQVAVKNIEQTRLLFTQSKMALLPQLTMNVAGSRTESSKNSQLAASGAGRVNDDFTASLDLSWELDIWGKLRREKEAVLATMMQTEEVKRAIQNRLVAEVATSYINLLMLDEQLEIAIEGIALRESTYLLTKKMFEVGNETIVAMQQAEAQWLESKELLPQIEQEIALQESGLNLLLNNYPQAISRSVTISDLNFSTDLNTGVPADFLSTRPDVQVAEYALKAANAKVGAAQGQMYPNLIISAQGGLNAFESSQWFKTPASLFGMFGGGLIQPIFNQKKLRTAYEIAVVEREKAGIEFKNKVIVGFTDVHNALVKIDKLSQKEEMMQKRVNILNTSLANIKFMFEMDKASYLEVINAQSLALQSSLSFAELKRDHLASLVDLYRALGGH